MQANYIIAWITLLVAVTISIVAAYFSVIGLTEIFAAAFWPVAIMAASLEAGKVTATVWAHQNWKILNLISKSILIPIIGMLMLVTSLGIFGMLSKGHSNQEMPVRVAERNIANLNLKIKISKDKIKNYNDRLLILNEALKKYIEVGRVSLGLKNTKDEINSVQKDIEAENDKITKLEQQKLDIRQSIISIEAKLGPITYVAKLLGQDNSLDKAVLLVIFILIFCFDPLALVLIILSVDKLSGKNKKIQKVSDKLPKDKIKEIASERYSIPSDMLDRMTKEGLLYLLNGGK